MIWRVNMSYFSSQSIFICVKIPTFSKTVSMRILCNGILFILTKFINFLYSYNAKEIFWYIFIFSADTIKKEEQSNYFEVKT